MMTATYDRVQPGHSCWDLDSDSNRAYAAILLSQFLESHEEFCDAINEIRAYCGMGSLTQCADEIRWGLLGELPHREDPSSTEEEAINRLEEVVRRQLIRWDAFYNNHALDLVGLFGGNYETTREVFLDIDRRCVGGESGPGARPMDPAWVDSILAQCRSAGVPFFFKQWGGVRKADRGRQLHGQTYDEFPLLNKEASG